MRRRPSRALLLALSIGLIATSAVEAQEGSGPTSSAALFLLFPTGARPVGMGHAVTASSGDVDAVWWNPAGIANTRRIGGSFHHSQALVGTGDALTVSFPSRLGVIALSANVLNQGSTDVTAPDSTTSGVLVARDLSLGLSWGVVIARRFRAGATWKTVQFRFDCTGECPTIPRPPATSAVDLGLQFDAPSRVPLSVGLALRHLGVRDEAGAEELPTRLDFGVEGLYRIPQTVAADASVTLALGAIDDLPLSRPLPRLGVEFNWESTVFVRGGYVVERSGTESGGPSLGLGFVRGRFAIDFGRTFSGLSADAGQAPTYISLKLGH
ncbi:MAG: hypothetical protein ACT4OZ_05555 [Gemmatimonadota bacterium]